MSAPTDEQRQLVTELLREEPFKCNRVFFFRLEDSRPVPLDAESETLYQRQQPLIDGLPECDVLENWAGNMVNGPRENTRATFYASYRFDHVMVVVSKVVDIPPEQVHVDSPFNKFFVDAIAARIAPVLGNMASGKEGETHRDLLEEKHATPFNALEAWRQCKTIWRKEYGPNVWLAVKNTRLIATAETQSELDQKLREEHVEPPLLYVPPETEETAYDIISTTGPRP